MNTYDETLVTPWMLSADLKKIGVSTESTMPKLADCWEEPPVASEAFRALIDKIVPTAPEHAAAFLFEAVAEFRNSYHWTGGVPDSDGSLRDVCSQADWFVFLDNPFANHAPLERRVAMAKCYLGVALQRHLGNEEFWEKLLRSLPRSIPGGPILEWRRP